MIDHEKIRQAVRESGVESESNDYSHLLNLIMLSPAPDRGLQLLYKNGQLRVIFPDIASMVGFGGLNQGHKDLWEHTKRVVLNTPAMLKYRWAALFHDVGKVQSYRKHKGKISFHNHEPISAQIFKSSAHHIALDHGAKEEIHFLIYNVGRIESYRSEWSDQAVRRLHRDLQDKHHDIITLAKADVTTARPEKKKHVHDLLNECYNRMVRLSEDAKIANPLPKGLGKVLIEELGLEPNHELGSVMDTLKTLALGGVLPTKAEPFVYVNYVKDNILRSSR